MQDMFTSAGTISSFQLTLEIQVLASSIPPVEVEIVDLLEEDHHFHHQLEEDHLLHQVYSFITKREDKENPSSLYNLILSDSLLIKVILKIVFINE